MVDVWCANYVGISARAGPAGRSRPSAAGAKVPLITASATSTRRRLWSRHGCARRRKFLHVEAFSLGHDPLGLFDDDLQSHRHRSRRPPRFKERCPWDHATTSDLDRWPRILKRAPLTPRAWSLTPKHRSGPTPEIRVDLCVAGIDLSGNYSASNKQSEFGPKVGQTWLFNSKGVGPPGGSSRLGSRFRQTTTARERTISGIIPPTGSR